MPELSIAVIIRPFQEDNWLLNPPFNSENLIVGEEGYIFANTQDVTGFLNYHLLQDRMTSVGSITNRIDFMQKTIQDSSDRNITTGIGGVAKLKDFTFSLANKSDLSIRDIYGREVEVRAYEGSDLQGDVFDTFTTYFKGIIYSVSETIKEITIKAQGKLANNNPRIKGEPYIDPDGNKLFNFIFLGESTNPTEIRLNKVIGPLGVQLVFDDAKYKIKQLLIKEKGLDVFHKVDSPFSIKDGKIFFEGKNTVRLNEDIASNTEKFKIDDGVYMALKVNTGFVTYFKYWVFHGGTPRVDFWATYRFSYFDGGQEIGVYRVSPNLVYEENWDKIKNFNPWEMFLTPNPILDGTEFKLSNNNAYQGHWIHEREGLVIPRYDTPFFTGDYFNLLKEGVEFTRRHHWTSLLVNDRVSQSVIRIDDEEMLVLFANDNYDHDEQREIIVIRAFNDTLAVAHSEDADVIVLSNDNSQEPLITIRKPVSKILYDGASRFHRGYNTWEDKFTDFDVMTDEYPYWWTFALDKTTTHDNDFRHLFFNPELPDLSVSELVRVYIRSKMNGDSILKDSTKPSFMAVGLAMTQTSESFKSQQNPQNGDTREDDIHRSLSRLLVGYNKKGFSLLDNTSLGQVVNDNFDLHDRLFSVPADDGDSIPWQNAYAAFMHMIPMAEVVPNSPLVEKDIFIGETNELEILGSWSYYKEFVGNVPSLFLRYFAFSVVDDQKINIQNYEELRGMNFALVAHIIRSSTLTMNIYISRLDFYAQVRCPLVENEWYATFKSLEGGSNKGTIITDTTVIGPNASMFLTGDERFLLAESDTRPFVVFELTLDGKLNLLDEALLATYPDLADGYLARFTNEDSYGKVANQATGFKWIQTVDESDSQFPFIIQIEEFTNFITSIKVGEQVAESKEYSLVINGNDIEVWKKGEIADGNPVTVIETLLITYAKHEAADLDLVTFDSVRDVRQTHANKCTIVIEDEINVNTIINKICKNFGLILFETINGLIGIADLLPPDEISVILELDDPSIQLTTNSIADYKIQFIDLRFLITDMTLRFRPLGNKFKQEIEGKNLPSSIIDKFETASTFTDNATEVAFHHESTNDKPTAIFCAQLKMYFHYIPTRIITVKTTLNWLELNLGTWIRINSVSNSIRGTFGKIYLIISTKGVFPVGNKRPFAQLELFEYDENRFLANIQEVYEENINTNYQEVYDDVDDIQEEYDGGI